MAFRIFFAATAFLFLSSCSYVYGISALMIDGNLAFIVDKNSKSKPLCVSQIEVRAQNGKKPKASSGDDIERIEYGTFWYESIRNEDRCANKFPVAYGAPMKGRKLPDRGFVVAKRLIPDTAYEVSATTGTTGYGGGAFKITNSNQVINIELTQ